MHMGCAHGWHAKGGSAGEGAPLKVPMSRGTALNRPHEAFFLPQFMSQLLIDPRARYRTPRVALKWPRLSSKFFLALFYQSFFSAAGFILAANIYFLATFISIAFLRVVLNVSALHGRGKALCVHCQVCQARIGWL